MTCYHATDGNFDNTEDFKRLFKESPLTSHAESSTPLWSWCGRKYRLSHRCVTSKSALIMLFWSFIVGLIFGIVYQMVVFRKKNNIVNTEFYDVNQIKAYSAIALLYGFYPLVGCLADLKFGRYKTVIRSVYMLIAVLFITIPILVPWLLLKHTHIIEAYTITMKVLSYLESIWVFMIALIVVVFNANIIQFGMDQLHDSPRDHQSLFIHWYFWTWNVGYLGSQIVSNIYRHLSRRGYTIMNHLKPTLFITIMIALATIILIVSLSIAHRMKRLFLIDSARNNPYKLVYRVTKFARQHKVPVHRSAFTYCEDEVPSGLDLGKAKYGGPFTTEQVEDVKAFYGILKVLLAMGPVFFMDIATDHLLDNYYFHTRHQFKSSILYWSDLYLLGYGVLLSVLIVAIIPLYICLVRPFISHYIPGMLKRIGLGILLMVISLICIFTLDTVAHLKQMDNNLCMFHVPINFSTTSLTMSENGFVLVIPYFLTSCYNLVIYISLYQFICSQSPHSMKGLLIGMSFAIKGVFELLGCIVVIIFAKFIGPQSLPSCGMEYYLMNICVGVVSILLYIFAVKKYKYRLRDEPCHVRRYVEEYYSKIQDERLRNCSGDFHR